MATTSENVVKKLFDVNVDLTALHNDLNRSLQDGDTSRYRLNGMSIPKIMGQIEASQKAILGIRNLLQSVSIKTK